MHVEKVEDHHREDGIPGDEGEIGIQEARLDGGIVAVEAEPEGQEVGDMDHGEVVNSGEESDDLPVFDVLQRLQVVPSFLRHQNLADKWVFYLILGIPSMKCVRQLLRNC